MLKAILFDLDGTLANTDPLHYQTWKEILDNHGIPINHNSYKQYISGRTNPAIIQDLLPKLSTTEAEELADYKEVKFREMAKNLQPLTGLLDLIEWIKNHKLQKAVVTNAPPENAKFMLEVLKLKDTFPLVILGGEMTVGKPDPAPYKLCLEKLAISPEEAIVFEDSRSGVKSAVGASIVINDFSDHKLEETLNNWNIYR